MALNTPTVFNVSLNFRLNWEGNFRTLEEGAEHTLRNPAIMASSAGEVASKLRADPEFVRQFRDAYGRGPDAAAVLDAIATYERSLVTPGSRFDRWLAGEADAITPEELSGYQVFKSLGCITCHQGVNVGGNLFQRHGIFHPLGSPEPVLLRVPSLRNVRNHSTLFPRRQRANVAGGCEDDGYGPTRSCADRTANRRHRRIPQHADGHLPRSVGATSQCHVARRPRVPMRNLPGVLGFSLLLALLTWLLLRGIDTNAPAYAMTLRAFDDYALAEASLHRDVLQARAGLLRDYDSFVSAVQAMQDAVNRLRSHAQTEGLDAGPVDRLAAAVVQQEDLMERFKTSNALLQNSLSYVGLLSTSPAFRANDAQLASAADALAAAVLYVSRDTSNDALKTLQERIDRFAEQAATVGPDAEVARAMLAHARLLYEQLPAIDETLKSFIAVPSRQPSTETRALFSRHRSMVEAVEQRFRLLLYLVSLLLLIMLVLLGLRLRAPCRCTATARGI